MKIERVLFHGTDCVIEEPKVIVSELSKDFGDGFYLTEIQRQAEVWAKRRSNRSKLPPIVNVYYLDCTRVINDFRVKYFGEPNHEWLEFVSESRSGKQNDYDYVEGPMVDDKLYAFVEKYLTGEINEDEFMKMARFNKPTHQILLRNDAIKCLTFSRYYEVEDDDDYIW